MQLVRLPIEWSFGKVLQNWAFFDFKKGVKVGQGQAGKLFQVGCFLTNCHSCLYGNQTAPWPPPARREAPPCWKTSYLKLPSRLGDARPREMEGDARTIPAPACYKRPFNPRCFLVQGQFRTVQNCVFAVSEQVLN